jgi:hypothetical protein
VTSHAASAWEDDATFADRLAILVKNRGLCRELGSTPSVIQETKKCWPYFIRKVCETNPLIRPKCQGEMRIISLIDQPDRD